AAVARGGGDCDHRRLAARPRGDRDAPRCSQGANGRRPPDGLSFARGDRIMGSYRGTNMPSTGTHRDEAWISLRTPVYAGHLINKDIRMRGMDWRFWGLVVLGVGVALGGGFAGYGFSQGRLAERYVTVKGVSEREVQADLAVWPLQITVADNDLEAANAQLARGNASVRQFMLRHGLDTTQVALTGYYV